MFLEFVRYTFPSTLSMFIASLYVIVDGIFVGRGIGDLALGAINIVFPLSIAFFGIASMFAVGGGTLISTNFGGNRIEEGIKIFRQVFKFLLFLSTILSILGVVFAKEIVIFLGATGDTLNLASTYLRYYCLFCIPNILGIALNSFIRNDGNPKLAMVATISGAIANIVLDYIFIFIFKWGIMGAAIATGLGQLLTIGIIMLHFIFKRGYLSFGNETINFENIKKFIQIGFPSFFAEITFSIIIFCINLALVKIGKESGLTAFSIINYITTNIYMILLGLVFGVQPLISYNLGAKNGKKMLKFYKMTLQSSVVVNTIFSILCFVFGYQIIGFFTNNKEIIDMAYTGLNLLNFAFFLVGVNLTTTIYYQSIEKPMFSNVICVLRSIAFLPIILFILSKYFGLLGIWSSMIFSEIFTFIIIILFFKIKPMTIQVIKNVR